VHGSIGSNGRFVKRNGETEMRKIVEASFVSLDGVVDSPQDWALPNWDADNRKYALDRLSEMDSFLFGRKTYEIFAARLGDDEYADRIYNLHKFVVSKTLSENSPNATVIKGNIAEEISKIKGLPGKNILKYGTSELDQLLIKHNLIDEFRFTVVPVVVGTGRRLFEGIDTGHLKLRVTNTVSFPNGYALFTYLPGYSR
jgi:dihydrofolate reductase